MQPLSVMPALVTPLTTEGSWNVSLGCHRSFRSWPWFYWGPHRTGFVALSEGQVRELVKISGMHNPCLILTGHQKALSQNRKRENCISFALSIKKNTLNCFVLFQMLLAFLKALTQHRLTGNSWVMHWARQAIWHPRLWSCIHDHKSSADEMNSRSSSCVNDSSHWK